MRGLVLSLLAGGEVPVVDQVRELERHLRVGEEVVVRSPGGVEEAFVESVGGVPSVRGGGHEESLAVVRMRERAVRARRRVEEGVAREVRAEVVAAMQEETAVLAMALQERLVEEGLADDADVQVKRLAASVAEKVLDRVAGKAVQVQETTHHQGDAGGWRGVLRERVVPRSADGVVDGEVVEGSDG